MTNDLKLEINYRNKLRNYYRKFGPHYLQLLRAQRSKLSSMISHCKSNFYLNKLIEHKRNKNSRLQWQELKSLGIVRSENDILPLIAAPDDINRYFVHSVSQIVSSFPLRVPLQVLAPQHHNTFSFIPVTAIQLCKALSSFKTKSSGTDDIPAHYLEKMSPSLLPDILEIMNQSLMTSVFPHAWKQAIIIPIPKIPKPTSISHYRPISLLCSLSKVLEYIVYSQLVNHLQTEDLLDPFQSAFKEGHSTQTAMLRLTDDISNGSSKGHSTGDV